MAVQLGKEDTMNGLTFKQAHLLNKTHAGMHVTQCSNGNYAKPNMHASIQPTKAMQKSYYRLSIMYSHLYSSTCRHGTTPFIQKQGKTPGKTRGRLDLFGSLLHGAV